MNSGKRKFFVGLGMIVIISGVYLVFRKDYVSGISGAMVGGLLIYLNMSQSVGKNDV